MIITGVIKCAFGQAIFVCVLIQFRENKYWENSSSTPTQKLAATGHNTKQSAYNKAPLSFKEKSDQNQNINEEALIAVKPNTKLSPGGDSLHFDGMGVKFTVDIAKSKYFETTLTKPKLTSTPDSGISSTKLVTDKTVVSMTDERYVEMSGQRTDFMFYLLLICDVK